VTAELSVVLVATGGFAGIRRAVRHLREGGGRERVELVLVCSSAEALADRREGETDGFAAVETVAVGAIHDVEHATAEGVRRASAPFVALLEDHAFPEPGWVDAILEAHRGPWAAVGPVFLNANPESTLSWANLLLAYGRWSEPRRTGETDSVALHNVSASREALLPYGRGLGDALGREGGLLDDLRAGGARFYLEPAARVAHVNPSLLRSTASLRFHAGRLYAASRARSGNWSPLRRAAYVAGAALIPALRFLRVRGELFADGRHAHLAPRVYPALLLALACDAAGQLVGYAAGPGAARARLAAFEHDRLRHVRGRERARLRE
jgi:hypothetical protein